MSFVLFLIILLYPLVLLILIWPLFISFLCPGKKFTFSYKFISIQFILSIFTRLLLDIITKSFTLLPLSLFLTLFPLQLLAGLIFQSTDLPLFHNVWIIVRSLSLIVINDFNPIEIKYETKQLIQKVTSTFQKFKTEINFTEVFQFVNIPRLCISWSPWESMERITLSRPQIDYDGHNEIPWIKDYGEFVEQSIQNSIYTSSTHLNAEKFKAALSAFLIDIKVGDIFNNNKIPSAIYTSLIRLEKSLNLVGKDLNENGNEGIIPYIFMDSVIKVKDSLISVGKRIIYTFKFRNIYDGMKTISPKFRNAVYKLKVIHKLNDTIFIWINSLGRKDIYSSWKNTSHSIYSIPISFYILAITSTLVILFVVILQSVFCAFCKDICLWLFTRRYKYIVPSSQRCISGWLYISILSGYAIGFSDMFPVCILCILMNHLGILSIWGIFFIFVHGSVIIPIRSISQIVIAEASVHEDLGEKGQADYMKRFLKSAVINGLATLVWLVGFVALIITLVLEEVSSFIVIGIDVIIAGIFLLWGRRFSLRVMGEECSITDEGMNQQDEPIAEEKEGQDEQDEQGEQEEQEEQDGQEEKEKD